MVDENMSFESEDEATPQENAIAENEDVIEELTKKNEELMDKIEQLKEEHDQLEAEKNELTDGNRQITSKFQGLHDQIQQLKAKINRYESATTSTTPQKVISSTSKPISPSKTGSSRLVCPKCQSSRINTEKDKSKLLSMVAGTPMYAKKKRCLKCSYEWTT